MQVGIRIFKRQIKKEISQAKKLCSVIAGNQGNHQSFVPFQEPLTGFHRNEAKKFFFEKKGPKWSTLPMETLIWLGFGHAVRYSCV